MAPARAVIILMLNVLLPAGLRGVLRPILHIPLGSKRVGAGRRVCDVCLLCMHARARL